MRHLTIQAAASLAWAAAAVAVVSMDAAEAMLRYARR